MPENENPSPSLTEARVLRELALSRCHRPALPPQPIAGYGIPIDSEDDRDQPISSAERLMRSVVERAIMPDKNIFDRYLLALRKTPLDDKTEHTDRSALQSLLQAIADDVADDL